ncbi:MAG: DUF429 domain-containing protein [Actinobacteria bacterium]|nr:DUF429 domain-containing protein [Actinomycetota bacterium]
MAILTRHAAGVHVDQLSTGAQDHKSGERAHVLKSEISDALDQEFHLAPHGDPADDHQLDALIAALVAGLARQGRTAPIPDEWLEDAVREGWIHVPIGVVSDG